MAKPTPGPWKIEDTGDDVLVVSDVTKETIATDLSTMADARLIAAAPKLLAVLKRAIDPTDNHWFQDARAVIAEAEEH